MGGEEWKGPAGGEIVLLFKLVIDIIHTYIHTYCSFRTGRIRNSRETSTDAAMAYLISGSRHWYTLGRVVSGKFERIGSLWKTQIQKGSEVIFENRLLHSSLDLWEGTDIATHCTCGEEAPPHGR